MDIIWPGVDIDSALNSLGKAVHAARHAFEPELLPRKDSSYLKLTDTVLILDPTHVVVDADRFEELADAALRSGEIAAYETALAAYGGELLPEDRYADWCAERRNFLAELRIRLLLGLAEEHERRGAYSEATSRLREVLRHDPTREVIHRHLMRLYAEMGTPDQAVRQFHQCEEILRRELDIAPHSETISFYRDVIARRVPHRGSVPRHDHGAFSSYQLLSVDTERRRPFVGRERVIQRLLDQLIRGEGGCAGLTYVSGETGVGKTRLLAEFAARASREGAAVLWGGGGAHAKHFACGPFAVALEGYVAGRPEAERDLLARRYPALLRFVPSLRPNDQAWPSPVGFDYQFDLIPAIVRVLMDLCQKQRVLIVLGDLHDIDPVSLDLIRYLAHLASGLPLMMIAAVRDAEMDADQDLRRTIDAMVRERLCLRVDLRCLSRQSCDRLVRALLPADHIGEALLAQIYERSCGNPFFIGELVRQAAEQGSARPTHYDADARSDGALAPPRVRALIGRQLAALDATSRLLLGLAAMAPEPEISVRAFRAWIAALTPPVSDTALFRTLDHALQLRVLEERDTGYAFRYPIVRSVLSEDLPLYRREQFRSVHASTPGREHRTA